MIRDPVAVQERRAPAMSCRDARGCFPALLGGQVGLTELAFVETHLSQCADCRQEEARLRRPVAQMKVTRSQTLIIRCRGLLAGLIARLRPLPVMALEFAARTATRPMQAAGSGLTLLVARIAHPQLWLASLLRLPTGAVVDAMEAIRLGVGFVADLIGRIRAWRASALELTARVAAGPIRVVGFGITRLVAGIAHVQALPASLRLLFGRAVSKEIDAVRFGITRAIKRTPRFCFLLATLFRSSIRAVGALVALAFALYALQQTYGSQQHARPAATPGADLEPMQLKPAQVLPSLPALSVELKTVSRAPSQIANPRSSPPRTSVLSPPRVPTSEVARGEFLPPVPVRGPAVSAPHIIGRLSAKDLRAAERDFTALLAGMGGTELGRWHRVRFTAVEVVVPQSRYNDFAQGLARIGSWRLEAAHFPLPDAVHITIRVSE